MEAVSYTKTGEIRPATSPAAPRRRRTPREGKAREGGGGGDGGGDDDGCRGLTPRRRKRYTGPQTPPPEEWTWLDKLQLDNPPLPSEVAHKLETLEPPAAVAYTQGRRAGLGSSALHRVHGIGAVCRLAGQGSGRCIPLHAIARGKAPDARHDAPRAATPLMQRAMQTRHPDAGSSGWSVGRVSLW
jgi:hypothetical protein